MIFIVIDKNGDASKVIETNNWTASKNKSNKCFLNLYHGSTIVESLEINEKTGLKALSTAFRGNTEVTMVFYIEKDMSIKIERNT